MAIIGNVCSCPLKIDGEGFDCRILLGDKRIKLGQIYDLEVRFLFRDLAQIGGKFSTAHVVEDVMILLETFGPAYAGYVEATVKAFVAKRLKDGEIKGLDDAGPFCGAGVGLSHLADD